MLDDSEVNKLVKSARIQLTEAWEILQAQDPDSDDYSSLRLITNDLKVWQETRAGIERTK